MYSGLKLLLDSKADSINQKKTKLPALDCDELWNP